MTSKQARCLIAADEAARNAGYLSAANQLWWVAHNAKLDAQMAEFEASLERSKTALKDMEARDVL